MSSTIDSKTTFLSSFETFERNLNGESALPLHELRRSAIARFDQLGFPTQRDEEWRFTNISPLTEGRFRSVPFAEPTAPTREQLEAISFDDPTAHRLVFVDGQFAESLSRILPTPDGVMIGGLALALKNEPARVETYIASLPESQMSAFAALNTAFLRDGAFIAIPDGVVVEEPIHLLFIGAASEDGVALHPRNVIVAGRSAQATVIEEYAGLDAAGRYFTNPVTQILLGANATVDHYKIQHESAEAVHVGTQYARLERDSTLTTFAISFGSRLLRNNSAVTLDGTGAHCTLDGLYLTNGSELVDNHTVIDHAVPHCTSHELYKGILNDDSRAVFGGRIVVRPDAQKTDSKQTNMNLLLSDRAIIDTKPQLEIYADDVKCTHGATIGQLEEKMIFYLRARGIGQAEARAILTYAFAAELVERIKVESVRQHLDELLGRRLEH